MSEIKVKCVDQILMIENSPDITSGDVNIDKVTFDLCQLWDGFTVVAVFYNDPENVYEVMLDENNSAIIPSEVMTDQTVLHFGVLGVKDDQIRTSNIIRYRILRGAIVGSEWITNPTPDIYQQLLSQYSVVLNKLSEIQWLTAEEVDEICNGTYAETLDDTNLSPIMDLEEITVDEVKEICQ